MTDRGLRPTGNVADQLVPLRRRRRFVSRQEFAAMSG